MGFSELLLTNTQQQAVKKKIKANEKLLVRRPCIAALRSLIKQNALKRYPFLYWACPPDLGRKPGKEIASAVLDGYEKGVYDLTIIAASETVSKVFLIEFKYGKNSYTPEQKIIAQKASNTPIIAMKISSLDEFLSFLRDNLI